ncbi:hypothetical protein D9611_011459 [Ephemerocybe angulata]|uniref:Uncharacterized protein n=1 Tax=Ephemerocybe angulata TaxID=980116 RepID=A0A8H5CD49_9AGAR|nr:hypothetical protein D9611_011459 [Tulosesus angulatus]
MQSVWILMDTHRTGSGHKAKGVACGEDLLGFYTTHLDEDEPKCTVLKTLANILAWEGAGFKSGELDKAIEFYNRVRLHKPGDLDLLSRNADAIWLRSRENKDPTGLPEAIAMFGAALDKTNIPSLKADIANNIGAIYVDKASFNNQNLEDFKQAHKYYCDATDLYSDKDEKAACKRYADEIDTVIKKLEERTRGEGDRRRSNKLAGQHRPSLSRNSRALIVPSETQTSSPGFCRPIPSKEYHDQSTLRSGQTSPTKPTSTPLLVQIGNSAEHREENDRTHE